MEIQLQLYAKLAVLKIILLKIQQKFVSRIAQAVLMLLIQLEYA
jgi:hypothetical protein